MILLLDNFDSFTFNLADYLGRLGRRCEVIRNDVPVSTIDWSRYSAVVVSPGPEIPETSGNLMEVLSAVIGRLPLLGICLGHQAIGNYYGAKIIKAPEPMHGMQCRIMVDNKDILFRGLPDSFSVVRYNSLLVSDSSKELKVTARSGLGEIMAITHARDCVHGVQFHPEAILSEYGLDILRNWVDSYSIDI